MSGIRLRAERIDGASGGRVFTPFVRVDDTTTYRLQWGDNTIALAPGRHRIECWYTWLRKAANVVSAEFDLANGAVLSVVYRTRWTVVAPGELLLGTGDRGPDGADLPPAGWYADPAAANRLRYWTGRAWTDHVSAQNDRSPQAPATFGARPEPTDRGRRR